MTNIEVAVIPAAGLGTRGLPATKAIPKELMPVFDTPSIHFIVEEIVSAGIKQVVLVVNSDKNLVVDYFDTNVKLETFLSRREKIQELEFVKSISNMAEIITVRQIEPLGLGHAVACAEPVVGNRPFAVLLPDEVLFSDVPGIKQLMNVQKYSSDIVLGLMEIEDGKQGSYGIADVDGFEFETGKPVPVIGVVEKPDPWRAPSTLALTGRYVLPADIFDAVRELKPSVGGEVQLTDAIFSLMKEGFQATGVPLQGRRFDLGNGLDYLCACVYTAIKKSNMPFEVELMVSDAMKCAKGVI